MADGRIEFVQCDKKYFDVLSQAGVIDDDIIYFIHDNDTEQNYIYKGGKAYAQPELDSSERITNIERFVNSITSEDLDMLIVPQNKEDYSSMYFYQNPGNGQVEIRWR